MFILDDLVIVAGAGVLFLIIIGVKGVRRRRLKKRLREDDEFRDKVKEALDEQEVQWVVNGVTAIKDEEQLQVPVTRISRRLRSKSEADALF
jgi:CRISPR/Cas system CMR subunit Cmr4 (Cas7 group RAMP superfamily)